MPLHQFEFREKHLTIDQVHSFTDQIEKTLEEKDVGALVFLHVRR